MVTPREDMTIICHAESTKLNHLFISCLSLSPLRYLPFDLYVPISCSVLMYTGTLAMYSFILFVAVLSS